MGKDTKEISRYIAFKAFSMFILALSLIAQVLIFFYDWKLALLIMFMMWGNNISQKK